MTNLNESVSLFRVAAFIVLTAAVFGHSQTARREPKDSLNGLWGADYTFGPAVKGNLFIDGRTEPWLASIAGFHAIVKVREGALTSLLPEDQGQFAGQLSADRRSITGHWIQPATVVDGYRFSTPVHLDLTAEPNVWRGAVSPLPDRLVLEPTGCSAST